MAQDDGLVIYLINLDGSAARLESARQQLVKQGLEFERSSAFDGRKLDLSRLDFYDDARARAYFGRSLQGGEIGCYLSHLNCAKAFLETGASYAVVLEDDVSLEPEFAATLQELLHWLNQIPAKRFDLINLGNEKLKLSSLLQRFSRFELHQAHYFPMTTTALLWSRAGAQAFVQAHKKIFAPVDVYFRFWTNQTGRGLAFSPPIARAAGFSSDIETAKPQVKRSRVGRTALYALKRHRRQILDRLIALKWKLKHRFSR